MAFLQPIETVAQLWSLAYGLNLALPIADARLGPFRAFAETSLGTFYDGIIKRAWVSEPLHQPQKALKLLLFTPGHMVQKWIDRLAEQPDAHEKLEKLLALALPLLEELYRSAEFVFLKPTASSAPKWAREVILGGGTSSLSDDQFSNDDEEESQPDGVVSIFERLGPKGILDRAVKSLLSTGLSQISRETVPDPPSLLDRIGQSIWGNLQKNPHLEPLRLLSGRFSTPMRDFPDLRKDSVNVKLMVETPDEDVPAVIPTFFFYKTGFISLGT